MTGSLRQNNFTSQAVFGHDIYHSNRKQSMTDAKPKSTRLEIMIRAEVNERGA